jgi:outer membrane protein assembly factor BamB
LGVVALLGTLVYVTLAGPAPSSKSKASSVGSRTAASTTSTTTQKPATTPESEATAAASTPAGQAALGVLHPSFLGAAKRNSYGVGPAPARLSLVWRAKIGSGPTQRKSDNKTEYWSGTGWTGQPTVVRDKGVDWLLIGGYDHNLHKIAMNTGRVAWQSPWPDVMKGTNTVVANPKPTSEANRIIVVSGSRRGSDLSVGDKRIAPLRAVSFASGKELWRLPVPKTANYSQDVDSSPLWYQGVLYAPVESGFVYALDPFKTRVVNGVRQPVVLARSRKLYDASDVARHPDVGGANLAVEASPSAIGDVIYITAGSGHVYGLDRKTLKVVWDYKTGSDIDGTPVVNYADHLLVTIEKQYIKEDGGLYMFDPAKPAATSPIWYFPTPSRGVSEWAGGSVGSATVNDATNDGSRPRLAAFSSVDGNLYVVSQDVLTSRKVKGPGPSAAVRVPYKVAQEFVGPSISTPAFVGDRIVVGGYDRKIRVLGLRYTPSKKGQAGALPSPDGRWWKVSLRQLASFATKGSVESAPLVWKNRVFVGSRDGYLYCLGQ